MWGLQPEDYGHDTVDVLPENWPVFELFCHLATQWHVGHAGATGLVYASLYPLLDRAFPSPPEWDQAFSDIRAMEAHALKEMKAQAQ